MCEDRCTHLFADPRPFRYCEVLLVNVFAHAQQHHGQRPDGIRIPGPCREAVVKSQFSGRPSNFNQRPVQWHFNVHDHEPFVAFGGMGQLTHA